MTKKLCSLFLLLGGIALAQESLSKFRATITGFLHIPGGEVVGFSSEGFMEDLGNGGPIHNLYRVVILDPTLQVGKWWAADFVKGTALGNGTIDWIIPLIGAFVVKPLSPDLQKQIAVLDGVYENRPQNVQVASYEWGVEVFIWETMWDYNPHTKLPTKDWMSMHEWFKRHYGRESFSVEDIKAN